MEQDKQQLSIDVARLYYHSDYSQQEIAAKLGISRPTVSRLLQYAKDQGYVRIKISDPLEAGEQLAYRLKLRYALEDVQVAHSPLPAGEEIIKHIGGKAAEYLQQNVKDGDIIGVTWGDTMYSVACQLKAKNVSQVEVVQLNGGVSYSRSNTYAVEILNLFAAAFHTSGRYLPLPVIFDTPMLKKLAEQDRHIEQIIELGKQANIAVFTVGTVRDNALLFRLGYFTDEQKALLQQNGVGDICSRFFDHAGNICNADINNRTVGINLDELRQKEKRILVAGGQRKIEAIRAALAGEYANVLITDQFTAKELLV